MRNAKWALRNEKMRIAKCKMTDAKCEMRNGEMAKCEMRNAKCEMRDARCEMRNAKCESEMRNAKCERNAKAAFPKQTFGLAAAFDRATSVAYQCVLCAWCTVERARCVVAHANQPDMLIAHCMHGVVAHAYITAIAKRRSRH